MYILSSFTMHATPIQLAAFQLPSYTQNTLNFERAFGNSYQIIIKQTLNIFPHPLSPPGKESEPYFKITQEPSPLPPSVLTFNEL